ncbi:hypothetical protein OG21DRAFT_1497408 [Imleria badia]|nr:hypothetical protein OG21DRAFT_1497408 [Imleria badia]
MPRPQAPAGFVTIGPGTYISLAPAVNAAPTQPNDSEPNVILVFGWSALTISMFEYESN